MLILAIDASAERCAAAVARDGAVIAEAAEDMSRGHAERLMPLIAAALAEAGAARSALQAIAVCTGPGNFTGVRIGVAAARGLALALGVPAVGVDRFAAASETRDGVVHLEARGGAAHMALMKNGVPQRGPETVDAGEIDAFVAGAPIILAPHADLGAIARIGEKQLAKGAPRPSPLYLRPTSAALPSKGPAPLLE